MSYTQTPTLDLDKAVPGTNQPFETTVINSNWDKVDTAVTELNGLTSDLVAGTAILAIDGGDA